jgi:hypothetical protein
MTARKSVGIAVLLGLVLPLGADADLPGRHPCYLHALSDLRAARWMLERHPEDAAEGARGEMAITEINAAIREINRAAIDNGKNITDHSPWDLPADRTGRIHKALELLRKVHADVAREEDDPTMRRLRDRAAGHIEAAIHASDDAVTDVERRRLRS